MFYQKFRLSLESKSSREVEIWFCLVNTTMKTILDWEIIFSDFTVSKLKFVTLKSEEESHIWNGKFQLI